MKNIHAFTKKSATVPHKLAFSVLRKQHFQGQISNHGYSPLPFHVSEPAKRRRCLGWNQWGNLARFPRNIFPRGKTLLGSRGTFSRAGKPCPVSEEHFPGRENLARFPRNIFQGGKTMLGFRGTFSRAGKACRARGERFPEWENLAALRGRLSTIICSPPSFPIRPHQGVCDTPLQLAAKNLHEMMPSITASHRTNGKYVGAQRHTPSMAGTLTKNGTA